MSKRKINKTVKTLSKKSNKFLAFLVVVLLLTNITTLYLWLNGESFPLFESSSVPSSSTIISSSNESSVVLQDEFLVLKNETCSELKVHYIELKNIGDSILIQCDEIDIIVDAGIKRDGTEVVTPFLEEVVEDNIIEMAIVTHYDDDHYGGFVGLKNQLSVFNSDLIINNLIDFGYRKRYEKTEYELARENLINEDNTNYYKIQDLFDDNNDERFNKIKLGDNCIIELLQTDYYDIEADDNDRSITFLLTYNQVTFFFGGDITTTQEARLLENYDLPQIDYYKASHHGSYTSNSREFLEVVNPSYIILNCVEGNSYGIPQKVAVEILDDFANGNIYVTGLNGMITVLVNENNPLGTLTMSKSDTKFIDSNWYNEIMTN